jgi:MoaA/NifB/PqqE/SkfB family radical SAM enzyme
MQASDITWLQVENTTRCNAWCPSCGRNNGGYGLRDNFVEQDLDINRFKEVLDMFPNLSTIQFCGTYGDALASPDSLEHIEIAVSRVGHVNIHTNGSLRNQDWWRDLAELLAPIRHEVWFTLDGLAGTHEIYRQGTAWQKVIDNATAFIDQGGQAVWQFIPFEHNQTEITRCIALSQQLGFKRFEIVRNVRYPDVAKHYQTGQTIEIKPWSKDQKTNKYKQPDRTVTTKDCRHLTDPSVYLSANGQLSPCCFFNHRREYHSFDQLPDIKLELEQHPHQKCLHSCGTCASIDNHDDN